QDRHWGLPHEEPLLVQRPAFRTIGFIQCVTIRVDLQSFLKAIEATEPIGGRVVPRGRDADTPANHLIGGLHLPMIQSRLLQLRSGKYKTPQSPSIAQPPVGETLHWTKRR